MVWGKMTTYEEDILDIYYNLDGYFTIKNIPFSAIEKRAGGKGRGEIDVLAIKTKDGKVIDAVHIEVGVSLTSPFPFLSRSKPDIDESAKILKKFFKNDAEHKIRNLIGNTEYRAVTVCGRFDKASVNRLKTRIPDFGGEVLDLKEMENRIFLKIKYKERIKEVEIVPFYVILNGVKKLFKEQGLENKNFQDPRYRGIQYLINSSSK